MTEKTASDTVAMNIRSLRKTRGWTVAELAARCTAANAGWLTDAAITNIELGRRIGPRGRRRVTVEELLAFSRVFAVPPLALLPDAGDWPAHHEARFLLDGLIGQLQQLRDHG